MITAEEYLAKVAAAAKASPSEWGDAKEGASRIANYWDIARATSNFEAKRELLELPESITVFKMPGWALFYELGPEAKDAINNHELVDSWIYDRTTGVIILNIDRGGHEFMTGALHMLYNTGPVDFLGISEAEDRAEKFIEEGLGFVLSSRASRPMKGANVVLTAQERVIFDGMNFRTL